MRNVSKIAQDGLERILERQRCPECLSSDIEHVRGLLFRCRTCGKLFYFTGFLVDELGISKRLARELVEAGVLEVLVEKPLLVWVPDPESYRVAVMERKRVVSRKPRGREIPGDLFRFIVGFEEIKQAFRDSIASKKPLHILLVGEPGTAKSMFLSELLRLPNSVLVIGGETTKAGLREVIAERRPKYLIIDELDKIRSSKELGNLLYWMEHQYIPVNIKGRHTVIECPYDACQVYAACNRVDKLPPELIDRFHLKFYIRQYTREEYITVVENVLESMEGLDKELAHYIAEKIVDELGVKSVRQAIGIARWLHARNVTTQEEVDRLIETLKKYSGRL